MSMEHISIRSATTMSKKGRAPRTVTTTDTSPALLSRTATKYESSHRTLAGFSETTGPRFCQAVYLNRSDDTLAGC